MNVKWMVGSKENILIVADVLNSRIHPRRFWGIRMNCPICGKTINIEKNDRRKMLENLTQMRIKMGKLDDEIKSIMKEIE